MIEEDIPTVELTIEKTEVVANPRKLDTSKWTFAESPFIICYGSWPEDGENYDSYRVYDSRTKKSRGVTNLAKALREQHKYNIRLHVRYLFKSLHVKYCNMNVSKITWKVLKAIGRGMIRYYKRDLVYLRDHGHIYPRKWL